MIRRLLPYPNPANSAGAWIYVELEGTAEEIEVRIFTKAMAALPSHRMEGRWGPGWQRLPLELEGLPSGLYYLRLKVGRAGKLSAPALTKIFLSR